MTKRSLSIGLLTALARRREYPGKPRKKKPEDYSSGSLVAWLVYSAMNLLISVVGVVPLALQAVLNASKMSGFRSRGKRA